MNLTFFNSVLIVLCLLCYTHVSGQRTCHTDEYFAERLKNDQKFLQKYLSYEEDKIDEDFKSFLVCNSSNSVIIPIAVHYYTPIDCSNKQCLLDAAQAQVAVLNETFAADNLDLSYYTNDLNALCSSAYPLSRAPQAGVGTCIQFCLATQNHPNASGLLNGEPAITVNQNTWPSAGSTWSGYLNIFVSDGASASQSATTLGISALPGNADGDGFWVNYSVFGGPNFSCASGETLNSNTNFDKGRTAVHEAGHYFGLNHVFQGSNCNDDDNDPPGPIPVNDTPAQNAPHYGCPNISSCSNAPSSCTNAYDNFYSFMDYSNDDCMVMFTLDQSNVINYWANFLTWSSDVTVCDTVTEDVNCSGPSCNDTVQNGNESGVDCGGDLCAPCNYVCNDIILDSGGQNNYFNNENTIWTVCATGSNVLTLSFNSFDVEPGGSSGCYDKLKLFDGPDVTANELGTYCGYSISDSPGAGYVQSTNSCLTLQFISDNSVTKNGWSADITCAPASSCNDGVQNGDETGVDCGGLSCGPCPLGCLNDFYDSGGSSNNYSNGENVSYLYCPNNPANKIQATFLWSDIEATSGNGNNGTGCWDMLKIYDGIDDSAPLIGIYCGEESGDGDIPGQVDNNLYVGRSFQASDSNTSGCLFFMFESDNSINESGWEAEINCILSSLPVELTDFRVLLNANNAELFWKTNQEINNEGFYVEKSKDGLSFESIAFVKSAEVASTENHYHYTDLNLTQGTFYYRLRQMDFDGSVAYSSVISVEVKDKRDSQMSVFPNPSEDVVHFEIRLSNNERIESLKIYNKLGVLVKELALEGQFDQRTQISLRNYARGTYIACLKTNFAAYIKQINKI